MQHMKKLTHMIYFTFVFLLITCQLSLGATPYGKPQQLVDDATITFKSFLHDPNMSWLRENLQRARGIFIVPQMLRGGFIVGGAGGSGILLAQDLQTGKWSYPAFYTMGSVSLGLQIGADASEIILMIMTSRGIDAMLSTEFKLGGDVAVAAGPVGALAKAQTVDVLAFGRSKGLFGGISIEGAVITPRNDWNSDYYHKPVRAADILITRSVRNPQADALLKLLPKAGPPVNRGQHLH